MITENDQLANALDKAAQLWPEEHGERAALLRRIIEQGITAIDSEHESHKTRRLAAISEVSGSMSGTWPQDWHSKLVDEWPA